MRLRSVALVLAVLLTAFSSSNDDKKEPAIEYTLTLDGTNYALFPGQELQVSGTFTNPKMTLGVSTTRLFSHGGIEFVYPSYFAWEAEIDSHHKCWTLSGNDFKIMYFVLSRGMTTQDFVDGITEQLGEDACRVLDTSTRLGEKIYQGKRILAWVAGSGFLQDVYALPAADETRLLVLQDTLPQNEKPADENELAMKLLRETFKPSF